MPCRWMSVGHGRSSCWTYGYVVLRIYTLDARIYSMRSENQRQQLSPQQAARPAQVAAGKKQMYVRWIPVLTYQTWLWFGKGNAQKMHPTTQENHFRWLYFTSRGWHFFNQDPNRSSSRSQFSIRATRNVRCECYAGINLKYMLLCTFCLKIK
jgi:hypothetical protein